MSDISRPEFDMLMATVTANQLRMEGIDVHGTRGIGTVQAQLTEVVKDLAELKASGESWQVKHTVEHADEKRERVTGRRWLIGAVLTATGVLGGIVGLLIEVLSKIGH
jgi:hypothetical protein